MSITRLADACRDVYKIGFFNSTHIRKGLVLFAVSCALFPATAHGLATISQGFSTTDQLALGSIVSLKNNTTDYVEGATEQNTNNLLGVVVNSGDSLLSLTSNGVNQVQVATSGSESVLVSNINGNINQGDEITASPIAGVGMKATGNVKVIAIAQGSLSANNGSSQSYVDKSGQKHSILLGEVPATISVAYFYKQPDKTLIPSAVQNIANALAGRSVSSVPILISMGIFIVAMVIVVSIVYSMIHGSIISVGRNPMSQSAVYRNLIQLSTLVVAILGVSLISIYLILTKT